MLLEYKKCEHFANMINATFAFYVQLSTLNNSKKVAL